MAVHWLSWLVFNYQHSVSNNIVENQIYEINRICNTELAKTAVNQWAFANKLIRKNRSQEIIEAQLPSLFSELHVKYWRLLLLFSRVL